MEHKGYNSITSGVKNNLKTYQGQEFTEDLGLNTHEWRYRISDPAIGRFWQIDPLAEKYTYNSTYAFQENKLGSGIELEGLENEGWTGTAAEQEIFYEMSREVQAVFGAIGSFFDNFFVSESNTVKQEVSKIGNKTLSNTTTFEIKETTTSYPNLEEFIMASNPDENGFATLPDIPITTTKQSHFIGPKNTTKGQFDTKRGSITGKVSVSDNLLTGDTKVKGSVEFGVVADGNSAGVFVDGSTTTSGDTKVRAGIRIKVKKENTQSSLTFGYEHKIED